MNILHVCADPQPTEESIPKQLAMSFFSKLVEVVPDVEITNIDLYQDPPPYFSYEAYRGYWFPILVDGYQTTDKEQQAMEYGLLQSEVVKDSDLLVISVPMWTFTMPGILKSWFDFVTAPGPLYDIVDGELTAKHRITKVILLVSSGEAFKEDDPRDILSLEMSALLRQLGLYDVRTAWADGQDPSQFPDCELRKNDAMEYAQELAEELADEES